MNDFKEKIEIKPEDIIKRSELITNIYHGWPSFHDFEIVSIQFERNTPQGETGPQISIFIHTWETTVDGKIFVFSKHNIVELIMKNVYEYVLKGFNFQNVINDIEVWQEKDHDLIKSCIHFPALFGADLLVKCGLIEVGKIEPGIPPHSIYAQ